MKTISNIHSRKSKWLIVIISILLTNVLVSCSKSNDPKPDKNDKVITVTIEHDGELENYQGFLNVNGTLDSDLKRVAVSGVIWDEEVKEGEVSLLTKSFVTVPKKIEMKTDNPVSGIQFGYTAWFSNDMEEVAAPIVVTVKYIIDNKVVKTETFSAGTGDASTGTYLGSLSTTDY